MKEVGDEVNFLHIDKQQYILQFDAAIFGGLVRHVQITNQITKFFEMKYHRKCLIDTFNFYMQKNLRQRFQKIFR